MTFFKKNVIINSKYKKGDRIMISISIINTLGILSLIFLIPIKYIHYAIIMLALLGQFAGSWEIFASYKYSKEEKERKILMITVICFAEVIMAITLIKNFIDKSGLNINNTIMNEIATTMLKVPTGTEFIYQIFIFLGIAIIIAGFLFKR